MFFPFRALITVTVKCAKIQNVELGQHKYKKSTLKCKLSVVGKMSTLFQKNENLRDFIFFNLHENTSCLMNIKILMQFHR
jgi:hypothetical protein